MRRILAFFLLLSSLLLAACGGGDGDSDADAGGHTPPPGVTSYRVSGTVTGLDGTLVLRSGELSFTITANGSFSAVTTQGFAYDIAVVSRPEGQDCTVANGQGVVSADVDNIAVSCAQVALSAPVGVTLTYGIKAFNLGWSAVPGATHYSVSEDPDGAGPAASTQLGTVTTASYAHRVGLLHTRLNARYTVKACKAAGCSAESAAVAALPTEAIGYFKGFIPRSGDNFAQSIALSGDGTTLAVGMPGEDSDSTVINGEAYNTLAPGAGAVFIYVRESGAWVPQAYIKASNAQASDNFGWSVSLSADGNALAVGAVYESGGATGVNGPDNNDTPGSGAAYVFKRSAGAWTQQAYVKSPAPGAGDSFGWAVALSADASTLAVGAVYEDGLSTGTFAVHPGNVLPSSDTGAVFVYAQSAGTWAFQAYLKASNTGMSDYYGFSVGLSADGNTLAVGAPVEAGSEGGVNGNAGDNGAPGAGAAYVYTRTGTAWTQQAYVKASNPDIYDQFAYAVALSADGNTLAAGAFGEEGNGTGGQADNTASQSGAVYVFNRNGVTWSQQAYLKAQKVNAGDRFGISLALSSDGLTLAVGAPGEDGNGRGVGADPAGTGSSSAGAAYVFNLSDGAWQQKAYLKAPNAEPVTLPGGGDNFGGSIALSGDASALAVGAPTERSAAPLISGNASDNSANGAGAAYLY